MATYYVWSGATGTNAGTSWTNAYTAFGSAVTAAIAAGDVILVHYTHQENLSANTTYTFNNNVRVISVNKDSSDAPTEMSTNGWIGHSTTAYSITLRATVRSVFVHGLTLRTAGSTLATTAINDSSSTHMEFENVYFRLENTNNGSTFLIGPSSTTNSGFTEFKNCTFKFGQNQQYIIPRCTETVFENCTIDSGSANLLTMFVASMGGDTVTCLGCNFSVCTNTLIGDDISARTYYFSQCKLGANITPFAAPVRNSKASGCLYLFDCSSGDTHTFFGYYDAFGSCVSDTGIYYTTGAAAQSWKIVTTANCSFYTPFVSPFVDFYNTGTSSITPRFEILRDGSTTAYQNDEVWGEFFVKTTSGSTQSTPYNDRMTLLGTPANQASGAGTAAWTGEAASAWSGKIDSGVAVTPAEVGAIRGRVVVGEPSITVYVDPQVRT